MDELSGTSKNQVERENLHFYSPFIKKRSSKQFQGKKMIRYLLITFVFFFFIYAEETNEKTGDEARQKLLAEIEDIENNITQVTADVAMCVKKTGLPETFCRLFYTAALGLAKHLANLIPNH
ncbi:unnamed protein product, partial [Mesorhabditis belari]|uniref:Uncharacterized protein n=1 Tax=Mesorhabditis belari TaxID=2138241 RepID=A0AAF3F3I8_9BILA